MSGRMTFLNCVCLTLAGVFILALAPGLSGVPPENANARDKEQVKSATSRLVTSPSHQLSARVNDGGVSRADEKGLRRLGQAAKMIDVEYTRGLAGQPPLVDPGFQTVSLSFGTGFESTGFETDAGDGAWCPGFVCGPEFAGCNIAVTGNLAQNCGVNNSNPQRFWLSESSRSCTEPHIHTANPFTGSQHLRFEVNNNSDGTSDINPFPCPYGRAGTRRGACHLSLFSPIQCADPPTCTNDTDGSGCCTTPLPIAPSTLRAWVAIEHPFSHYMEFSTQSPITSDSVGSRIIFDTDFGTLLIYKPGTGDVDTGVYYATGLVYKEMVQVIDPCNFEYVYFYDGFFLGTGPITSGLPLNMEQYVILTDNSPTLIDIDDIEVVRDPATSPCESKCGNGVRELGEDCDGDDLGDACVTCEPDCTCSPRLCDDPRSGGVPCVLGNGENGPYVSAGGWWVYDSDSPAFAVNTCDSEDVDTFLTMWSLSPLGLRFENADDDCDGGAKTYEFEADSDPLAPCYNRAGPVCVCTGGACANEHQACPSGDIDCLTINLCFGGGNDGNQCNVANGDADCNDFCIGGLNDGQDCNADPTTCEKLTCVSGPFSGTSCPVAGTATAACSGLVCTGCDNPGQPCTGPAQCGGVAGVCLQRDGDCAVVGICSGEGSCLPDAFCAGEIDRPFESCLCENYSYYWAHYYLVYQGDDSFYYTTEGTTWLVSLDYFGALPIGSAVLLNIEKRFDCTLTGGAVNCCTGTTCQLVSLQQCIDSGGTVVTQCLGDNNNISGDDACEGAIPPGEDCWRTKCGRTKFSFSGNPIPADFFGPGSEPFDGVVTLGGGGAGDFDTSIRRLESMVLDAPSSSDSTPIELAALDLIDCAPIEVLYDTAPSQFWHVSVGLSTVAPSPGTLTATKTHENGGTFAAEFFLQPRYTFTRVDDPNDTRILDTGTAGMAPTKLETVGQIPWVHVVDTESAGPVLVCGDNFAPGVEEILGGTVATSMQQNVQCCGVNCWVNSGGIVVCFGPTDCTSCPNGACCDNASPLGACLVTQPTQIRTAELVCTDMGAGARYLGDGTNCSDSDGDTIPDVWETNSGCVNPDNCDTGTNPNNPDTDGDGCSDGAEVSGGSDPCDACDSLSVCVNVTPDCNGNNKRDECDIRDGTSKDCNNNKIPDDCENGSCCGTNTGGASACVFTSKQQCDGLNPPAKFCGPCVACPPQNSRINLHSGQLIIHTSGTAVACPPCAGILAVAGACDPLALKIDPWRTQEPDEANPVTCHNFRAAGEAIPADFFGPGSDPFSNSVCLEGAPLGLTPFGEFGDADTLIARTVEPFDRCSVPTEPPTEVTFDVEIIALSLISVDPITVTFNGGQNPEQWDVAVDLSEDPQEPSPLTARKTHGNGGVYGVFPLNVQPRFTFTKVSNPADQEVLDRGLAGLDPISLFMPDLDAPNAGEWVHDLGENSPVANDPCSDFHPGTADNVTIDVSDCNLNTVRDRCDIEAETSLDCNESGVPDECELTDNDCNMNGIPDECDPDCNQNDVPDDCDVDESDPDGNGLVSLDCNNNGIPDECEADCNQNDVPDSCDVDGSDPDGNGLVSLDCNSNGIPDECEADCNHNGIPDACDLLVFETSEDCTGNKRPDECDIRSGVNQDCNANAVPDDCDIAAGTSPDVNSNGIPDECEIIPPVPLESASNPFGITGGRDLNRAGGFVMPTSAVAGGQEVAIRVKLVDMYSEQKGCENNEAIDCISDDDCQPSEACVTIDPDGCPNRMPPLADLSAFEGQVRYLGPPSAFDDNDTVSTPQFVAAELQCTPFYRDWNPAALTADLGAGVDTGTIYYYGAEVLPCSVYEAQQGTEACIVEFAASELCFSTALEIRTALWGDVWPPIGNVSFTDIGKIVDAFKSIPFVPGDPPEGAPKKVRAMLRENSAPFDSDINFTDIGKDVDAFKTIAYQEDGPTTCP